MHIAINSSFNTKALFHVDVGTRTSKRVDDLAFSLILLVSPLGEDAFVEIEKDCVEGLHLSVKDTFHVSVSSQGLLDVSDSSAFRSKLTRLEVVYVLVVVEHKANRSGATMNLERMTAQHNSLQNNAIRCARQKISISNERH